MRLRLYDTFVEMQGVPKVLGFFFRTAASQSIRGVFLVLFVLIKSATNGLYKTGLSLKMDQAVPKLWLKWSRPLQSNVYGKIVYSYMGHQTIELSVHKLLTAHAQSEF